MKSTDFLGNEWDIDCMGCAVAGQSMRVPGGFIRRTQHFCVHQDPLIPLPGFLVIASIRHIRSVAEMTDAEYAEFAGLLRDVQAAIREATQIPHLTLIQEESSPHFHLWFFPWTKDVLERYGPPSLTKIRPIMADYRQQSIGPADWQALEKSIEAIKSRLAVSYSKEVNHAEQ